MMTEPTDPPEHETASSPRFPVAGEIDPARREKHLRAHHQEVVELRRLMERLVHWAAVIESSDDAIFGKTLEGIITSWNYGAERMYGYDAEEVVGGSVAILFPPERLDEFEQIMAKLRAGERIDHFETVRVRKDGTYLDVSVTISPIFDVSGHLIGVASIGRDITESKRLEERRLAFAAAASHELKTPLTLQQMVIDAMKRALDRGNVAALPRLVKRLQESQDRQVRLVDGLLDLSRLERGVLVAEPKCFLLNEVVAETTADLGWLGPHQFVVEEPGPIRVVADRGQVGQILINLLTNAVKYSPDANRVEVRLTTTDGWASVAVRDFGIGLSPEDQTRVFEPFVRGEDHATAALSGMGLGLYLASQLAALQGGRLRVESMQGEGATFTVDLPLPTDIVVDEP